MRSAQHKSPLQALYGISQATLRRVPGVSMQAHGHHMQNSKFRGVES
jgi:hypothetical protein